MACLGCNDFSVGLGIFPILFCVVSALTFLTTYMIAVSNNHLYPWLPTISDTGGDKPEANIFSLFLSISSFLCLIVTYIRYRQFNFISDGIRGVTYATRFTCCNKASFVTGIVASVGAGIVASFQDRGVSLLYHGIGALAVFGGGVIYCWIQTYMTNCMLKLALNTRRLFWIRATLSTFATIFLFSFLITIYYASKDFAKRPDSEKNMTKWNPHDPGFKLHVISSSCEWLLGTCLFLYFLSFTKEFNKMKVGLRVQRHLNSAAPFLASSTSSQDSMYA